MIKKRIIISSFIILLLSVLMTLYYNTSRYNMEVDGVKLAVTLDGNEVNSFPKDSDYYVDINCTNVIGEYLYDEDVETFKLTFKNIESGAKCNLSFTSNPDTLIDVVESSSDVHEEEGVTNFTNISQENYNIQTPFYTTSWSTTVTSGTDEAAAISWDSTNNYWVTNPAEASKHYYYLITVVNPGYYQLCVKYLSGATGLNRLYRYKNTINIHNVNNITVYSDTDVCINYGYVETTDTIRIDQYTHNEVASLALYLKKSSSTIEAGYRYVGEDPNNYVWFNNELWRIIGSIPTKIDSGGSTTTTNLVKIIRNESIGALVWNTSSGTTWNTTSVYTLLNNYYYSAQNATGNAYCYGYQSIAKSKCDYRDIGIDPNDYYGSMIREVYWKTGRSWFKNTPQVSYAYEVATQTMKGNVGIMNLSDYGFAASYNWPIRTSMNLYNTDNYTGNNWLFSQGSEMSITWDSSVSSVVSNIEDAGGTGYTNFYSNALTVRPVVYLDPSLYVVSGDGTILTPYKIAWPSGS